MSNYTHDVPADLAHDLAVAYHAYHKAVSSDNSEAIRVWGRTLLSDQHKAGIALVNVKTTRRIITAHGG